MAPTLSVSPAVKKRLDDLLGGLRHALGDNLKAVLVYGSAVRGEYREGVSDVDLMVVLAQDPPEALELIAPLLQLARFSARIEVMLLRADEITNATDCFPVFYEDVARCHVVLAGTNPFIEMKVDPAHRRLRIEQELREARIRLRRVATDQPDNDALGRAVERKVKQLRGPLHALLQLRGDAPPDSLGGTFEAVGLAYKSDVAALFRTREAPHEAYRALTKLLDLALVDVDARQVAS